jgi:protein-tyrosine phosphatase
LLRQGVEFIRENKRQGKRVLVACGAGINRSGAFCIAALKEEEGMSLLDAYKEVKEQHYDAMLNQFIWQSLCSYYNEKTSYLDVLRLSI